MSSPSRSKSVPITMESAFAARFLSERMMPFSAGTRYGRLGTFQPLMSIPSFKNGLRLVSYGGRGRSSGMWAGMTSPSAVTAHQPSFLL